MTSNLIPTEAIDSAREHHIERHSGRHPYVYLTLVFSVCLAIVLLPFLFVDVSVHSVGLLKASAELSVVKASVDGLVEKVLAQENRLVKKGDVLVEVRSLVLEERETYLQSRIAELTLFLSDLKHLTAIPVPREASSNFERLKTAFYKQALADYTQKRIDRQMRLNKITQDYERNKKLYDGHVIALTEFENFAFERAKAQNEVGLLQQSQQSNWQSEMRQFEKDLAESLNQLKQIQRERESLNIIAPVSGTIQSLAGIYRGSRVFANQDLGQISPDTNVVAEVYVSPTDIGLLHVNMHVRIQVGAFNYNQWGMVDGSVADISDDILILNDKPVFKVRCVLSQRYLSLKNGYHGTLKKGMTIKAHFRVTRRSLWQMLYDHADNWMNPATQ